MNDLVTANVVNLPSQVSYGDVFLEIPDNISFEDWQRLTQTLFQISRSNPWWIADSINKGEKLFGEMYAQAMSEQNLDYQTLANFKWTASKVDKNIRRNKLSFAHHMAVAPLNPSEQARYLKLAEDMGLTRDQLRDMIKGKKEDKEPKVTRKKDFKEVSDGDTLHLYEVMGNSQIPVATFHSRTSPEGKSEEWDDVPIPRWYCDRLFDGLKKKGYLD